MSFHNESENMLDLRNVTFCFHYFYKCQKIEYEKENV